MSNMVTEAVTALFEQRKRYGLFSEVARHVGVTPQSVREWAAGTTPPTPQHWPRIEEYFGLPAGSLADIAAAELRGDQPTVSLPAADTAALAHRMTEMARQLLELTERVRELDAEVARLKRAARRGASGSR